MPAHLKNLLRYLTKDKEMFLVFAISVTLGLSYLIWRAFFTIDYSQNLIWPLTLLFAETYSFIVFAILTPIMQMNTLVK